MQIINLTTRRYPMTPADVMAECPHMSFPVPFEVPEGYAEVAYVAPPAHDPSTERLSEGLPLERAGALVQRWEVVLLSDAEVAAILATEKARLMEEATAKRWAVETGGISLPNGMRIDTARPDQDAITRVVVNAQAAGITNVRFKAASGWTALSIDQLRQIASAVAKHVQGCYDSEHDHHVAIAAINTLAEARAYNVEDGWPGVR